MFLEKCAELANTMADEARKIALKYFRQSKLEVTIKKDESPVTKADKEIEKMMREKIQNAFSDHGIWGEEEGKYNEKAKYVWIIDPIDGTKNFIMGRPLFGVIIALLCDGKPILGLIDQPYTEDRWFAVGSQPTIHNGKKVSARRNIELKEVRALSSSPDIFKDQDEHWFKDFKRKVNFVHWETECYGYGLLAMGLVDIVIEKYLKPHDFFPLVKIVENAGGIITDFNGKELTEKSEGKVIAAGDKQIHNKLLKLISEKEKTFQKNFFKQI